MTKPAKLKLQILQGATFRKRLRWKTGLGTPIDLTGCSARMQVREDVESSSVLLSLSSAAGSDSATSRIELGGPDGTVDLYVSAEMTRAIRWSGGVWDLEVVMANDDVIRLAEGSVSVSPEVTRD